MLKKSWSEGFIHEIVMLVASASALISCGIAGFVVSGLDGISTVYFCTVGLLEFPEESCAVKVNVYSPALGFGN